MQLSSAICRAQEARQHTFAASTSLPNVRDVAVSAAAAWGKEARAAEKREERKSGVLAHPQVQGVMYPQPDEGDRMFSENPDRGFADRPPS